MAKLGFCRLLLAAIVLATGLGLLGAGCFGGGEGTTLATTQPQQSVSATTTSSLAEDLNGGEPDTLSEFHAKDPFIQQAVATTGTTNPTSTSIGGGSTTTYRPPSSTSTTKYTGGGTTTTYSGGGSTTTTTVAPTSTTSTTAPHLHTMKILSIGNVGGAAAVTFKVDTSVYKDKRVGDVVSTSWGQMKVLDLSTSGGVVTLLHGSETLVLSVGQVVYE